MIMNEESRIMMYPHTIKRVGDEVLMVARNWFDFFDVSQLNYLKNFQSPDSPAKEIPILSKPTGERPAEQYICRMVDGHICMDSTLVSRTIMILASNLWEILE
jgi:hypothetical protein